MSISTSAVSGKIGAKISAKISTNLYKRAFSLENIVKELSEAKESVEVKTGIAAFLFYVFGTLFLLGLTVAIAFMTLLVFMDTYTGFFVRKEPGLVTFVLQILFVPMGMFTAGFFIYGLIPTMKYLLNPTKIIIFKNGLYIKPLWKKGEFVAWEEIKSIKFNEAAKALNGGRSFLIEITYKLSNNSKPRKILVYEFSTNLKTLLILTAHFRKDLIGGIAHIFSRYMLVSDKKARNILKELEPAVQKTVKRLKPFPKIET